MVVIKCNMQLAPDQLAALAAGFQKQAEAGVLTLPYYCSLLTPEPEGNELTVLSWADGAPITCTGCDYMREYANRAAENAGPSKLICPHHYTVRDSWVCCPIWPYNQKQEAGNG